MDLLFKVDRIVRETPKAWLLDLKCMFVGDPPESIAVERVVWLPKSKVTFANSPGAGHCALVPDWLAERKPELRPAMDAAGWLEHEHDCDNGPLEEYGWWYTQDFPS